MKKIGGWRRGAIGMGALVLVFLSYCALRQEPPSLNLGVDGCWELLLRDGGHTITCWLDPLDPIAGQHIRVLVREAANTELSTECADCKKVDTCGAGAGQTATASTTPNVDCRDLVTSDKQHQKAVLRLRAQGQTLGERTIEIIVPKRVPTDDLRLDWRATKRQLAALNKFIPEAQRFLDAQPAGDKHDRAQILFARIRNDKINAMRKGKIPIPENEVAPVRAALKDALAVAQKHSWLGTAAILSEELGWLYRYHEGAVANLDAMLDAQPWLPLLPISRIHTYRWLIGASLEQHDLRRVERYLGDALTDADALQDAELFRAMVELRAQHIEQLALTGSREDVLKGLRELELLAKKASQPCDQAYIWGNIGWTQLQLWELGWPAAQNPIAALERAKQLRQDLCPGPDGSALANVLMNLARARSARWRTTEHDAKFAATEISTVQQNLVDISTALGKGPQSNGARIDQLLVETRLYLLQKKPAEALESLRTLRGIKELDQSPIQLWLATMHQAEAEEASGLIELSLATFRKAEALLVTMQGHVPIYQSHRLMLERFGYGSQRAVELALRLQRPAEALQIIRQANQRALGLTMTPWWSTEDQGSDKLWEPRRYQREDYLQKRYAYETELTQVGSLTKAECQELGSKKSRWLGVMDSLFREPAPALFTPPQLPPHELLIACAKQQDGWVCLGEIDGVQKIVRMPGTPTLDRPAIQNHLFIELAEEIKRATKIRVLAGGALAQLNLAEMSFQGQPLGTRKPIRYTLDRPPVTVQKSLQKALLVVKPEDSIAGFSVNTAYQQVAPALKNLSVIARSGAPMGTALKSWEYGTATSPEVLKNLQDSDVFVYLGHVNPMPCPTQSALCAAADSKVLEPDHRLTAMCLGQNTALSTADLLVARNVPQRVALLGCASTDRSSEAPTEMLGLAQALALRGAQVLALAQPFLSDQAQEILCALGQEQLASPDFDMDQFVMNTQLHLYRGERCKAQGKWFNPDENKQPRADIVWSALRSYGP